MSLSPETGPTEPVETQSNRASHRITAKCACGCTDTSKTVHSAMAVIHTKQNKRILVNCEPGGFTAITACIKKARIVRTGKRPSCTGVYRKTISKNTARAFPHLATQTLVAKKTSLKPAKGWWIIAVMDNKTGTKHCPTCGTRHTSHEAPKAEWVKITAAGTITKAPRINTAQKPSALDTFIAEAKQNAAVNKPPNFGTLYSLNAAHLKTALQAAKDQAKSPPATYNLPAHHH